MMTHQWRLSAPECAVLKYCRRCQQTTEFRHSGKTRRNANGKTLFQFDIFKCSRDHTWNRSVPVNPAGAERSPRSTRESTPHVFPEPIAHEDWCRGIEIQLEHVEGKWRLDKTLTLGLAQSTRAGVARLIRAGGVLVNNAQPEGKRILRSGDVIKIFINNGDS